jgi:hypothetical protein
MKRKRSKTKSVDQSIDTGSAASDGDSDDKEGSMNKRRRTTTTTEGAEETPGRPKVGTRIEICDPDNIWSSAKIVKVQNDKSKGKSKGKKRASSSSSSQSPSSHTITLRYDGWGAEWDETLPYENNPRLAKYGTYTKQLRCLVDLFPKRAKWSTLWPCIVNVRAPNPMVSLEDYALAEEFLRQEPNIFIQPYGMEKKYLPQNVIASSTHGGRWTNTARIRMWRNDINAIEGKLHNNFNLAHKLASNDPNVPDTLPYAAIEKGSLISSKFRIMPEGYITNEAENQQNESSSISSNESVRQSSKNNSEVITNPNGIDSQLVYEPPAVLPPAIKINSSIYPDCNIRKSTKTDKWIASFHKNGNEIMLGSFSTQTQAHDAIIAATSSSSSKELPTTTSNVEAAKIQDMKTLSLGTLVSLGSQKEDKSSSNNQFSLHNWTVQHTKHKGYELEKYRAKFEELKKERELRAYEKREGRGKKVK